MPLSIRVGLLCLCSIGALAGLPLACQSGGVGDPCTPEDEYNPQFSGYAMAEDYIESRSFQCSTRICLVNHFQGRVSCPLGQSSASLTHAPNGCQAPGADAASNAGKACCVPGTDTPVSVAVCGQCDQKSNRDAAQAVYCSCRCGVADGAQAEPGFNFCDCPTGFSCSQIRSNLDLGGDRELTGKYCIKDGSAFKGGALSCGEVAGNHDPPCSGVGSTPE